MHVISILDAAEAERVASQGNRFERCDIANERILIFIVLCEVPDIVHKRKVKFLSKLKYCENILCNV